MPKPNVLKFVGALAVGVAGLVAALPWHEILSVQTAGIIVSAAGAAGTALAFLGLKRQ